MNLIGNGVCDAINVNKLCQFDGLDCCYNSTSVDDGTCNLENLNQNCNFDGKDCRSCVMWRQTLSFDSSERDPVRDKSCSTEIHSGWPGYCECGMGSTMLTYSTCEEACEFECYFENCTDTDDANEEISCPFSASVGNGVCNPENNHAICNYDGGDCCPNAGLIKNDQCDYVNYNHVCQFDGGDCCYKRYFSSDHSDMMHIGDGTCTKFHNHEMCNYDMGDCCFNSRIADGICDDTNNNRICHYDGGDCCFGNKNTSRCSFCKCVEVFDVMISMRPWLCRVLLVFFIKFSYSPI